MVSGLITGAYGFGAFIFGFLTTFLVNPDNARPVLDPNTPDSSDKYFPLEVANRVPGMLRTCCIIWALLSAVAICTVTRNPEFVPEADDKEKDVEEEQKLQKESYAIGF